MNKIVESKLWANQKPENGLDGGWDLVNKSGRNLYGYNGKTPNVPDNFKRGLETQKFLRENDPVWLYNYTKRMSYSLKEYYKYNDNAFKGKSHTTETKESIGRKSKIHQSGAGNSQYGTMWITDGSVNRKLKRDLPIPEGWHKGRRIKIPKTLKPPIFKKISICKDCTASAAKEKAYFWYKEFQKSESASIREFIRLSDYNKSHVSFIKMLKTYITDFKPEKGKSYIPHDPSKRTGRSVKPSLPGALPG